MLAYIRRSIGKHQLNFCSSDEDGEDFVVGDSASFCISDESGFL